MKTKSLLVSILAMSLMLVGCAKEQTEDTGKASMELTNAEIVKTLTDGGSTSTSYTDVTFKSASGDWKANTVPSKSNTFVQLRNKNKAHLLSPEFDGNITKVELVINARTVIRTFYALPVSTELTDADYAEEIFKTAYGSATCEKSTAQTITIEFTGDTKQFNLIVGGGAAYVDAVKVYYTPEK